jgi:hypothetical protein
MIAGTAHALLCRPDSRDQRRPRQSDGGDSWLISQCVVPQGALRFCWEMVCRTLEEGACA